MKKLIAAYLFISMAIFPSLSFAIDRCGWVCAHEAAPFYAICKKDLEKCSETDSNECVEKNEACTKEVRTYQLECVDLCIKGIY